MEPHDVGEDTAFSPRLEERKYSYAAMLQVVTCPVSKTTLVWNSFVHTEVVTISEKARSRGGTTVFKPRTRTVNIKLNVSDAPILVCSETGVETSEKKLLQLAHRKGLRKDRSHLICLIGHLGICHEKPFCTGRCVNLVQGGVCSSKFNTSSDLCA